MKTWLKKQELFIFYLSALATITIVGNRIISKILEMNITFLDPVQYQQEVPIFHQKELRYTVLLCLVTAGIAGFVLYRVKNHLLSHRRVFQFLEQIFFTIVIYHAFFWILKAISFNFTDVNSNNPLFMIFLIGVIFLIIMLAIFIADKLVQFFGSNQKFE